MLMGFWRALKESIFLADPIRESLADLHRHGRPRHDLETKLHVSQFNRQQVVNLIQLFVSLVLVLLTAMLIYVTTTLREENKTINKMMPLMMQQATPEAR